MRKKILSWFLSLSTASSVTAATGEAEPAVSAANTFGCELYTELKQGDENLFFSPASITLALAMTRLGAAGATAAEFDDVLHLAPGDAAHAEFARLRESWLAESPGVTFRVANRLFGERTFDFLPTFLNATREHYGAPLEPLDFRGAAERARRHINGWVANQTEDKIQDLLPAGVVNSQTALVLANAIYFQGDWQMPFDDAATSPQPFTLVNGSEVTAYLMQQRQTCGYAASGGVQVLTLPYAGDALEFVAILPKQAGGLADLEARLTDERLAAWLNKVTRREVNVLLPRFDLETEFRLDPTLVKLGLASAFAPSRADFSGMSGRRDLFISAVLHKAYIELNEKGTEAAAATGVVIGRTSVAPRPPTFRADHPFVFLIRHRPSGSILFMGRMMDPR